MIFERVLKSTILNTIKVQTIYILVSFEFIGVCMPFLCDISTVYGHGIEGLSVMLKITYVDCLFLKMRLVATSSDGGSPTFGWLDWTFCTLPFGYI